MVAPVLVLSPWRLEQREQGAAHPRSTHPAVTRSLSDSRYPPRNAIGRGVHGHYHGQHGVGRAQSPQLLAAIGTIRAIAASCFAGTTGAAPVRGPRSESRRVARPSGGTLTGDGRRPRGRAAGGVRRGGGGGGRPGRRQGAGGTATTALLVGEPPRRSAQPWCSRLLTHSHTHTRKVLSN